MRESPFPIGDIQRGETLTMQDLLYGMALQSANEAANIVADYLGNGSISDFVELMNQKAKEIGAVNTHFTNPHGLYGADHYTTAYDIYLIAKYALSVPGFQDLVSTTVYTAQYADKHTEPLNFYTTNKMMVKNSDYYYEGLSGIKTGTLPAIRPLFCFHSHPKRFYLPFGSIGMPGL